MADTVQSMLEAKIEDELGYSKYDYPNKETTNSRNGYYPKTITASDGEFVVDIPRDREGIFEPKVLKKAVYVAIGVKIDGTKEVLGLWIGANESSKYWLSVLTEIRNRGVEDILIISIDNLKGFFEAIQAVYPYTEIQKCIVHQIRNSTRFVSYKDLKSFTSDLKEVYKATTEEIALGNLDKFEEKWGKKYPGAIGSWRANWHELSSFFKYPPELRKLIYTTNSIENFTRQLRKVTKSKSIFPTDDALFKMLYLATVDKNGKKVDMYRLGHE